MFTYPTTSHYNRDDIRLRNWYISEVVRCCSDLHRFLLRLLAMGPQKKRLLQITLVVLCIGLHLKLCSDCRPRLLYCQVYYTAELPWSVDGGVVG